MARRNDARMGDADRDGCGRQGPDRRVMGHARFIGMVAVTLSCARKRPCPVRPAGTLTSALRLVRRAMQCSRSVLIRLSVLLVAAHAPALPASPLDRIAGMVNYPDRSVLPDDATLTVELLDFSKVDARVKRLARLTLPGGGRQFPLAFELPYYPADIQASHRYAVRAMLSRSGELLYTTAQNVAVITQGAGTQAQLELQRVDATPLAASEASLENTYWKLITLGGRPAQVQPHEREAYLLLLDGRVSASSGCNKLMGSYTQRGPGELLIGPLGSTHMACLPGMKEQEAALLAAYARATRYRIRGETLELMDVDQVLARFGARHFQ
ncbi:MAG: hypothetical protein B7Y50_01390 [Hydrogenophilales bacterium 28-61-11]|nr:MAG: hypothetical protein B7Y50_01390 [Hydrogenophilales bacterium 28-61-11]OYZ58167.1 MAG: hypothetical protein B7Y21_04715 [Hydrogenophilales bacterium 16-61-112]